MLDLSDPSFEPQDSLLLFLLQHSKPRVRVNALKVLRTALKQVTELNTGNVPFFRAAGTRDLDRLAPHLPCAPPPPY